MRSSSNRSWAQNIPVSWYCVPTPFVIWLTYTQSLENVKICHVRQDIHYRMCCIHSIYSGRTSYVDMMCEGDYFKWDMLHLLIIIYNLSINSVFVVTMFSNIPFRLQCATHVYQSSNHRSRGLLHIEYISNWQIYNYVYLVRFNGTDFGNLSIEFINRSLWKCIYYLSLSMSICCWGH